MVALVVKIATSDEVDFHTIFITLLRAPWRPPGIGLLGCNLRFGRTRENRARDDFLSRLRREFIAAVFSLLVSLAAAAVAVGRTRNLVGRAGSKVRWLGFGSAKSGWCGLTHWVHRSLFLPAAEQRRSSNCPFSPLLP